MEDWRDLLVVLMFWFPPLLILILFLQVFYLYVWNEPIPAGPRVRDDDAPRRTLIVLGSGGHTAEMFAALAAFPPREYHPRTYVLGDTDVTSAAKVDAHEASVGDALAAEEGVTDDDLARWTDHSTRVVPRAREVSQSFVTSAFTTLRALWVALRVVRQEWPERPEPSLPFHVWCQLAWPAQPPLLLLTSHSHLHLQHLAQWLPPVQRWVPSAWVVPGRLASLQLWWRPVV